MKKRILSLMIAGLLLLALLPMTVIAAGTPSLSGLTAGNGTFYQMDSAGQKGAAGFSANCTHYILEVYGEQTSVTATGNGPVRSTTDKIDWTDGTSNTWTFGLFREMGHSHGYIQVAGGNNFTDNVTDYTIDIEWNAASPAPIGYSAALDVENPAVALGERIRARVSISHSDGDVGYNAYDVAFSYDPAYLTLSSAAAADGDAKVLHDPETGIVHILGYGENKSCDVPAVTAFFIAKTVGESQLHLTAAKVDSRGNALIQNAPEAALTVASVTVAADRCTVTLPAGFTGETTAEYGQDYTFAADDIYNDYTLSATVNGEAVIVTDNGDGTYTIGDIRGNIVVMVQAAVPKSFAAQLKLLDGAGNELINDGDAAFPGTATYQTDHTFTVHKDNDYNYTVSATVGGSPYVLRAEETDGVYTIPGNDVKGDVVVTVVKTLRPIETAKLIFTGAGAGDVIIYGNSYTAGTEVEVSAGRDVTFILEREAYYSYTVTLYGEALTEQGGVYTIAGEKIQPGSTVTVTVGKEPALSPTGAVSVYLVMKGATVYRVTARAELPEGMTLAYDGQAMYQENGVYFCLVTAATAPTWEEVSAKLTAVEGAAASCAAGCDVNGTGREDINDAQLVYDMYNCVYAPADVALPVLQRADVNRDGVVDTRDCVAIISAILSGI